MNTSWRCCKWNSSVVHSTLTFSGGASSSSSSSTSSSAVLVMTVSSIFALLLPVNIQFKQEAMTMTTIYSAMPSVHWILLAYDTRSSADADKSMRRAYRSVKVTKHSTIPYVRYSFLLCNSNFVFKTPMPIFQYSSSKNVVTLKSGSEVTQGHWKWYHSIDWLWFLLVFYINYVQGQWKYHHAIERIRLSIDVLY